MTQRHATAIVELTDPPDRLDLGMADVWHVLLTVDGVPRRELVLPSPGCVAEGPLLRALVLSHGDELLAQHDAVGVLRRRLGAAEPEHPRRTCTVIVCTHRRPTYVPDLLAALGRLDPAPDEIVIVDNAPGDLDCRALVEAAGARYVREDRKGLDRARMAGLAVAQGELVAFTDDDCVPSPGWLRALPELFANPVVAAVTGPAFAYALDTPAQRYFEASGGFRRGWSRRSFDLTTLRPAFAGQVGAGANMIYRRSVLEALGEAFPPELDAGTSTESGGDMYALYKILAAGHRAVYDPGTYVLHQHRPDVAGMHRTFWGYGVGLSAVMTKVLVEEHDLGAVPAWWWLWQQYRYTMGRRLLGRAGPVDVRVSWDYLRGGFSGARAWRAARRELAPDERRPPSRSGPASTAASRAPTGARPTDREPPAGEPPAVSVIIPTVGRPRAVERCVAALARERAAGVALEVVLVDDSRPGSATARPDLPTGVPVRHLETSGQGAAAARNAGAAAAEADLLLFLDDDLIPEPGLIRRHLERQPADGRERIVIGYSPPRPARRTLAGQGAALWWEDHYQGKRDLAAMTFVEALTGNMSVRRATWDRLGPFDVGFGRRRREDWDWGIRALRLGAELVYEHGAVAGHEFNVGTGQKLGHAVDEGAGDALLVERCPEAIASLPAAGWPRGLAGDPRAALALLALRPAFARRIVATALDVVDRSGWPLRWQRLFLLAYVAAYAEGFRAAGGRRPARPVLPVELASDAAIPAPAVASAVVDVRVHGRRVARVPPHEGRWSGALASRIADAVPWLSWHELVQGPAEPAAPDLRGLTVLLGPGRRPRDDAHAAALETAGAVVRRLEGPRAGHWATVDAAARETATGGVVLAMPGAVLTPASLAPAATALGAPGIGALAGVSRRWRRRPGPLHLLSAARPYAVPEVPPDYVLVPAARYAAVAEAMDHNARLGLAAPMLEVLQGVLDSGGIAAVCDIPPTGAMGHERLRRHWDLHRSRALLFARRATRIGALRGTAWYLRLGAGPVAADVVRSIRHRHPRPAVAAGRAAAFATGSAQAVAVAMRRNGARPEAVSPRSSDSPGEPRPARSVP
jgi:glycosyltransferase involved in cell wall biosynthesis